MTSAINKLQEALDALQDARKAKRLYGTIPNALRILGAGEGDPCRFTWFDVARIKRSQDKEREEANARVTAPN